MRVLEINWGGGLAVVDDGIPAVWSAFEWTWNIEYWWKMAHIAARYPLVFS